MTLPDGAQYELMKYKTMRKFEMHPIIQHYHLLAWFCNLLLH